jgi:hypothetical protein
LVEVGRGLAGPQPRPKPWISSPTAIELFFPISFFFLMFYFIFVKKKKQINFYFEVYNHQEVSEVSYEKKEKNILNLIHC